MMLIDIESVVHFYKNLIFLVTILMVIAVMWLVPVDFWNNVRHELDKIKPVFMLAELSLQASSEVSLGPWEYKVLIGE